jgi:hypothetical protein
MSGQKDIGNKKKGGANPKRWKAEEMGLIVLELAILRASGCTLRSCQPAQQCETEEREEEKRKKEKKEKKKEM